jgi:hypothetical protein
MVRSNWGTPSCAQAASKLYVLLLNGDTFGVNGTQIRIMEEVDEEGFRCLLQCLDGLALPSSGTRFGCDGLRNFSNLCEASANDRKERE